MKRYFSKQSVCDLAVDYWSFGNAVAIGCFASVLDGLNVLAEIRRNRRKDTV